MSDSLERLRKIALDLLGAYASAEHAAINEFSSNPSVHFAELEREVADLRKEIESIT